MQYVNQLKVVGLIVISVLMVGCNSVSEDLSLHEAIELSRDSIKALAMTEEEGLPEIELQTLRSASDEKFEQAVTAYGKLIEESPEKAVYYNNLAWLLIKLGELDEARGHLEKAQLFVSNATLQGSIRANLEEIDLTNIQISERKEAQE